MADPHNRGKLKIYLGYAAGVGKTYQMLDEAQTLKRQGADVVIGYFEPHARKDTIKKTEGLETIPRRRVDYRGTAFEEMDAGAILERHPRVCVVDEFAHSNVPGSERAKRWEDVQVLLEAGIDVLTTMNIQHLESLNDQVWQFTGIRVRETIPDWVMQQAAEVVMIDLTPRALLNRLERGVVYSPEKAQKALENFFRESSLVALRELALRQTAHEVEIRQTDHDLKEDESAGEAHRGDDGGNNPDPERLERILIFVTAEPTTAMLIRRGKRVADYLQANCFAVAVHRHGGLDAMSPLEREAVERHLNFARNLHIETRVLEGDDVARTLVDFARLNGATQIFLARRQQARIAALFGHSLVQEVVRLAHDMHVIIVAERRPQKVLL